MSDTIRSMRFAMLATVAMVAVACGSDPSLEVVVTHPSSTTVDETTVTDYESATVTCEDVEFSRLDAVQLAALAVTSETIGAGGQVTGSLSGMSRTENKVIVARGFASGKLVAIGCGQKGEVTGKEQLKISTFVAAIASIKPPGMSLSDGVTVNLTNAQGAPIEDKRPVSWTVYGPAFSDAADSGNATVALDDIKGGVWQPVKPTCTKDPTGIAKVHPNPPMTVGGYAVQVRPAWAIELPPLYTSLTNADFTALSLAGTPPATVRQYCAVHVFEDVNHVKQSLLACMDGANSAQQYRPTGASGRISGLTPMGPSVSIPSATIAIVSVPAANGLTDVYAVTDAGMVMPLFGSAMATNDAQPGCPIACDDVLVVPPCGSAPGRLLLSVKATNNIRQLAARGGSSHMLVLPIGDAPGGVTLDNAGCVTQLAQGATPSLAQFATFHELNPVGAIAATKLMPCPATGDCSVMATGDLARGAGTGFTGGTEPRAIITSVDATGVVLVQVELGSNGSTVELSRVAAAGLPDHVTVGQLDKDGEVDVVWNLAARAASSFEVAYSRDIGNTGQALEALSGPQDVAPQSVQMTDFDGNSFDDLVILLGGKVAIIPMGVTIPVMQNSDPVCDP